MTDDELDELRRAAANHRDDLIIQLGGYVGLRAFEIPQVKPNHVKRTYVGSTIVFAFLKGKIPRAMAESLEMPIFWRMWKVTSTAIRTPKISIAVSRWLISPSVVYEQL